MPVGGFCPTDQSALKTRLRGRLPLNRLFQLLNPRLSPQFQNPHSQAVVLEAVAKSAAIFRFWRAEPLKAEEWFSKEWNKREVSSLNVFLTTKAAYSDCKYCICPVARVNRLANSASVTLKTPSSFSLDTMTETCFNVVSVFLATFEMIFCALFDSCFIPTELWRQSYTSQTFSLIESNCLEGICKIPQWTQHCLR